MKRLHHTYSNTIYNKKVVLIGILPPPLGGISVHLERIKKKLELQGNTVLVIRSEFRLRRFLLPYYVLKLFAHLVWFSPDIIYYHGLHLPTSWLELRVLGRIKTLISAQLITIEHNSRHMGAKTENMLKKITKGLAAVDHLVFIGTSTCESYAQVSIIPKSFSIESAFLPPDETQEDAILATYPQSLFSFIQHHSLLVVINAFQLSLVEGKDLYGIDFSLQVLNRLREVYPKIGLVCAIAKRGDEIHWQTIQSIIKNNMLESSCYVLSGQRVLWPLLKKADIFLRPTLNDGYAISIEEALHFGIPVVASDVVDRPEVVTLFKTGDCEDCVRAIMLELEKKERIWSTLAINKSQNSQQV